MNLDKEIKSRVEFKLNDILTGIKNRASISWHQAFQTRSREAEIRWKAFSELVDMFNKEINMPLPYDEMAEHNRKIAKDKSVEIIRNSLNLMSGKDYHKIQVIVKAIEDAQFY